MIVIPKTIDCKKTLLFLVKEIIRNIFYLIITIQIAALMSFRTFYL